MVTGLGALSELAVSAASSPWGERSGIWRLADGDEHVTTVLRRIHPFVEHVQSISSFQDWMFKVGSTDLDSPLRFPYATVTLESTRATSSSKSGLARQSLKKTTISPLLL